MLEKVFALLILATFAYSQDYCNSEALNCKNNVHVGCNHKGVFDPVACKKWPNVQLVNFGKAEINLMVDAHNLRRNEAAYGNAVPGATGSRLCTMHWHPELAKIASFNVLSCLDDHDKCRNTYEFPYCGQNIYNWYNTRMPAFEDTIEKSVESWYKERTLTNVDHIKKKTRGCSKNGHFTQMVWHNSCFVGCASATWNDKKGNYGYVVCNYNFGNMIDNEIYPIGKTASECITGPHKKYNGLCSSREIFETPKPHGQKNEKFNGKYKLKEDDHFSDIDDGNANVKVTTTKKDNFESYNSQPVQKIEKKEHKEILKTHGKISFDDFDFEAFKAGLKEGENGDFEKNDGKTRVRYHVRYN